jgi:hypothetical protein
MFMIRKPSSGESRKILHFNGKCNETKKQSNNQVETPSMA